MMKIRVMNTQATTAVIYNDNTNAILTLEATGKLSLSKAKKYFKNEYQLANAKTIEVLAVTHEPMFYNVDDTKLHEFLKSNGELVVASKDEDETDTEQDDEKQEETKPEYDELFPSK